jgi:hypothetical protein
MDKERVDECLDADLLPYNDALGDKIRLDNDIDIHLQGNDGQDDADYYFAQARMSTATKVILLSIVAMAVGVTMTIGLMPDPDGVALAIVSGTYIFMFFVILFLWPTGYEVTAHSVNIVLCFGLWRWRLLVDSIFRVERIEDGMCVMHGAFCKCAPGFEGRLQLYRRNGFDYLISPEDPDEFMTRIRRAQSARRQQFV